jgi:hypothetical protein
MAYQPAQLDALISAVADSEQSAWHRRLRGAVAEQAHRTVRLRRASTLGSDVATVGVDASGGVLEVELPEPAGMTCLMIGRYEHVVIDCPDPRALASFYMQLLGMQVEREDDEWVVIRDGADRHRVAFQRVPDFREPQWPDPERPQQFHIDVMVEDIEQAEAEALKIGASRLPHQGPDYRVYADPVGHPFCLCWA